jgi:hypothetical protein
MTRNLKTLTLTLACLTAGCASPKVVAPVQMASASNHSQAEVVKQGDLSWNPSVTPSVVGYNIYTSPTINPYQWTLLSSTVGTNTTIYATNKQAFYAVEAVDSNGNMSPLP